MNYLTKLIVLMLFLGFNSCGHQHQKGKASELLKEAAMIHQEAINIEQALQPELQALIQRANGINIQGRALTEEEMAFVKAVENLRASYGYWEENHVEVPGFEHEHGHDHDHDHHHGPGLEVSPADMLLIQKEFRDSILSIKERIEKLQSQ